MEYRQFLGQESQGYAITNDLAHNYGNGNNPPVRLISCKGVELEDFYWPKDGDVEQEDIITKMLNGKLSEWVLVAVHLRCTEIVFCLHSPKYPSCAALYLEELQGVELQLEVKRDDGLSSDIYVIDSTEDVFDDIHDQGMPDNGRSMFRPRVTEWDGHKRREIVMTRERSKLSSSYTSGGEYDYWADITECY
jgi:hypothetical protein